MPRKSLEVHVTFLVIMAETWLILAIRENTIGIFSNSQLVHYGHIHYSAVPYKAIYEVHRLDRFISEWCCKGTILQRNYRKMTFSYNSFVKFHGKKNGSHSMTVFYPICVIRRCDIKGLHCIWKLPAYLK